jgi:hypothetical protein
LHRSSSYGCNGAGTGCDGAAENDMKIYLLMLLIGTLLTAIRFTSAPKQPSETIPQQRLPQSLGDFAPASE